MSRSSTFATGLLLVLHAAAAGAGEADVVLADGPGRELVQAACSMCHSLDYIVMNSPFLDQNGWERTVNKMVTIMGAPLSKEEVAAITAYLDRYYGKHALP